MMYIPYWVIPLVLSLVFFGFMFRPIDRPLGDYDFSGPLFGLFRLMWIVPILIVWLIYFVIF